MSHAPRSKARRLVRALVLRLLEATARDIRIRHHWIPGHTIRVNSFRHKGYWWHGRKRELNTLSSIASVLEPSQTVLDVGANIGYFTAYFAHLVGPTGRVIAFEPGVENLDYARFNTRSFPQVTLDARGIADAPGVASFFVESLTGQNNSLVEDYWVLEKNAENAGIPIERHEVKIEVTTIDDVCRELDVRPAFIKMDIEGAELEAVRGMRGTLTSARPIVLLEISRNHHACWRIFRDEGYRALDERLKPTDDAMFAEERKWPGPMNFFFVPE